jgi:hypothetical protein
VINLDFLRNTARVSLGADVTERLKLKNNLHVFNRKSLNEGGLGSVLFNALNTPSTLHLMMRMVILQKSLQVQV